jgi:TatD DNase family protein
MPCYDKFMLIDTHCHIHEANYPQDAAEAITRAHHAGVGAMICVGTGEQSSREALDFTTNHESVYASIGVHPHDTKDGYAKIATLAKENTTNSKLVAIGEIGLDYFYTHSPREIQVQALEEQLQVALNHNLPVIFHVREAFDDFWPIFDNFPSLRGVLHSFTDTKRNLEEALKRELFIGINGISTFTKDVNQQEMFRLVPLDHMLFETDAPFLTPTPLRGSINEPAFVRHIAEFHAKRRNILLEEIAARTTANARALFALS